MTQDPNARPSRGTELPPVDQVIHDIRESEGHLRTREAVEAVANVEAPGERPGDARAPTPAPPASPAAGAAAGTGHEPSGHAPGHKSSPDVGHADPGDAEHRHAAGEALGPIDAANWGAGILGVLVGLVIVACFAFATQGLGAY
ncbi:MAG: hypothetical protein FJ038_00710 [Chloroflexi bacterium]|nr:hypothetical protein [Chloroflexota bacterium]